MGKNGMIGTLSHGLEENLLLRVYDAYLCATNLSRLEKKHHFGVLHPTDMFAAPSRLLIPCFDSAHQYCAGVT